MNPADVLAPSETPVAMGRFRGWPPLGRAVAFAVLALAVHGACTVVAVRDACANRAQHEVYASPFFVSVYSWKSDLPGADVEQKRALAREFSSGSGSQSNLDATTGVSHSFDWTVTTFFLPTWLVPVLAAVELARGGWWRRRRWVATAERVVGLDGADRWVGSLLPASPTAAAAEARAQELLRRRVPLFGAPADVEDVLAPGERLVWDGRARGLAPLWRARAIAAGVLVLLYCGVAALDIRQTFSGAGMRSFVNGVEEKASSETNEWQVDWLSFGVSHTAKYGTPTPGRSGSWGSSTQTSHWPTPIVFLPVFAAIELVVIARFRARRYALTNERVFALGWRGQWRGSLARSGPLGVAVAGSSVTISGDGGQLRFDGLEDPHAVASALEAPAG